MKRRILFILSLLATLPWVACVWNDTENDPNYLAIDDTEYPYANLPRFVIETDDFEQIRDTDMDIPAKLQIWGEKEPMSQIFDLTVKGHGNSSFHSVPQFSINLEFNNKISILGMPKNKNWVLISNFVDKTAVKNAIIFNLAQRLNDEYSIKSKFVELFLNREYMGVYLISESIKVASKRINIPENDSSFLFEKTSLYRLNDPSIQSKKGYIFRIRSPKNPSQHSKDILKEHLDLWENVLFSSKFSSTDADSFLDVNDFIRYFWIQEFSKNHDGRFNRSILFTWEKGKLIKMGPLWDFDESFGNNGAKPHRQEPTGWFAKNSGWFRPFFDNPQLWNQTVNYWIDHKNEFQATLDSIDAFAIPIKPALQNHFKRWDILSNENFWAYQEGYSNYDESLDSLKSWIQQRIQWIDQNL